jgi:hypothetical protein
LLTLLQKRRTDPYWRKVRFIRNYIGPLAERKEEDCYIDVSYRRGKYCSMIERPRFVKLWARA